MSLTDREILARAAEIKKKNKALRTKHKRQPRPKAPTIGRDQRWESKEYRQWINQLPCIVSLARHKQIVYGCDACHVRSQYPEEGWRGITGLGRKCHDWRTVPMLRVFHAEQHAMNEVAFWKALDIYPPFICADLRLAFPDVEAGIKILRECAKA